jgi:hypothetical protein
MTNTNTVEKHLAAWMVELGYEWVGQAPKGFTIFDKEEALEEISYLQAEGKVVAV